MIPTSAVKEYLSRPRSDHRWLKQESNATIMEMLHRQYPEFKPYLKLHLHQKVCCLLGLRYPRFSIWADMGAGKTLTTLELLRYWWKMGYVRRALVFVVSDKAFPTWEKQIRQYSIGMPYVALDSGSSEEKWKALERFDEGIVLLHYPGTVAMVSRHVQRRRRKRDGDTEIKGELELDKKQIARLLYKVDAVVLDESVKVGNTGSLTHKLCKQLARQVDICYALSGRPFGRDPTLLWAQQLVVDGGKSLGETVGLFRAAFFTETENPWDRSGYSKDYTFRKKMMPVLTRLAQHRSITYKSKECVELPAVVPIIEEISLPQEANAYYRRLVRSVIEAKGNVREMKNAFVRMRQISSGFLGFREDVSNERIEIAFESNPKLDRLMELVEAVPEECSVVIFYDFTWSGRHIVQALEERELETIWLWSGTKNARRDLERFTSGRVKFAVINNRIGAYSLDGLQVANYQFFYESPVSSMDREQAERRIERQGQTRKVFRYDLVVRGTLDQRILDYHREGKVLFDVLTKNPAHFFTLEKKNFLSAA